MTITFHGSSVASPAGEQGRRMLREKAYPKIYAPPGMISEMCTRQRQLRYMCHTDYCYCKKPAAVASSVAREGFEKPHYVRLTIYVA